MKAHKIPATYFDGWRNPNYRESFYVFYKNNLNSEGILKNYRSPDKITLEHGYFMDTDFYYVDFRIDGIEFKLEREINDFFNEKKYIITCIDDLAQSLDGSAVKGAPEIVINSYSTFLRYKDVMDTWQIVDNDGAEILPDEFKDDLNTYVFEKVGEVIEKDYFANTLELKWNDFKNSLMNDINGLNSGDDIILSQKKYFMEFVAVQYLRLDSRIKKDILPVLKLFEDIFLNMGMSEPDIIKIKEGILSPEVYFFAPLLDAARGDKTIINEIIDNWEKSFCIDILDANGGGEYLTSSNPCFGTESGIMFPIDKRFCASFRKKKEESDVGRYVIQSDSDIKRINNTIIKMTENIVVSSRDKIVNLI